MERISNNLEELQISAKLEIENFDLKTDEKIIVYFAEFPSIAGFPFKIALVQRSDGSIYSSFRQWNSECDLKRWINGTYALDSLSIITEIKAISSSDNTTLRIWLMDLQRFDLPHCIDDKNAIVLDGSNWEFGIHHGIHQVNYHWRAATADFKFFIPFITLMKNQHTIRNGRH